MSIPDTPLERLQWLSQLGAGLGCVLYAWGLRRWPERTRLHGSLGIMLLSLGAGMIGRAMSWVSAFPLWAVAGSLAFAALPLALARLYEHFLRRGLPVLVKLIVLTLALVCAVATVVAPGNFVGPKGALFASVHLAVVLYLGAASFARRRHLPPGPRRSLLSGAALAAWFALPFMATDWADALGFAGRHVPRLGACSAFFLLYLSGVSLHVQGAWGMRRALINLALMGLIAMGLALLLETVVGPLSLRRTLAAAGTLLAAGMLFVPLSRVLSLFRERRTDVLLARLSQLHAADHAQLVAELRRWPEIRTASILQLSDLRFPHESFLVSLLRDHGGALSRGQLEALARFAADDAQQNAIEAILVLLQSQAADDIHDINGQSLVAVGFDESVNVQAYTPVMQAVAHQLRLLMASAQRATP